MTSKWASAWQPRVEGAQSPLDKIRRELAETRIDVSAVHSSSSSSSSDRRKGADNGDVSHSPSKWQGGQMAMEIFKQQRREVMFEEEQDEEEEEYEQDINAQRYEDDVSSALDDCHERQFVGAKPSVGSMSYYTDPSVPLSLFLLDGVLPPRHDDDDHTVGGGVGQGTSSGSQYHRQHGYRKSPLENTLSPPKPLVNASTSSKGPLKGSWETPVIDKQGRIADQPLTFHTKVKSSGYGQPLPQKMAPRKAGKIALPLTLRSHTTPAPSRRPQPIPSSGTRLRSYPQDCYPMTLLQSHNEYHPNVPIFRMTYAPDASQMAYSTSESTVSTLRLPVARFHGEFRSFLGHNARVTTLSYSHTHHRILSSSEDGSVMMWNGMTKGGTVGGRDIPLVVMTHQLHHVTSSSSSNSHTNATTTSALGTQGGNNKGGHFKGYSTSISTSFQPRSEPDKNTRNRPFGSPIICAQFFYVDKFVLLAVKATTMLYSYHIDREGIDHHSSTPRKSSSSSTLRPGTLTSLEELKNTHNPGRYQRVAGWNLEPAQGVTALCGVNSVQSPLIFCATSDRKLHVLDAAVGCIARSMDCGHDRSIHHIALPSPSVYASLPMDNYGLFATTAMDNAVGIWDVRDPSVVMRYTGHTNRHCEHIQCALSPCLRYLAVGSEDRSAHIVDLRMGKELARLSGHRDIVTSVAFNPLFPQLATASFDGKIKFWIDPYVTNDDPSMLGKV